MPGVLQVKKQFHVTIVWPGSTPWLVLVEAVSKEEARRMTEDSDDVRSGGGKVTNVVAAEESDNL